LEDEDDQYYDRWELRLLWDLDLLTESVEAREKKPGGRTHSR
jgi:hypothetical protein